MNLRNQTKLISTIVIFVVAIVVIICSRISYDYHIKTQQLAVETLEITLENQLLIQRADSFLILKDSLFFVEVEKFSTVVEQQENHAKELKRANDQVKMVINLIGDSENINMTIFDYLFKIDETTSKLYDVLKSDMSPQEIYKIENESKKELNINFDKLPSAGVDMINTDQESPQVYIPKSVNHTNPKEEIKKIDKHMASIKSQNKDDMTPYDLTMLKILEKRKQREQNRLKQNKKK